MQLLDLTRRAKVAKLHVIDGRIMAPRGVDPALLAEVRNDRAAVILALTAWAESDERQDLLGVTDEAVREGCRLDALAAALREGGDEHWAEYAAMADALAGSPMVAAAVREGATVERLINAAT